ncbi:amino acid adenylation domain-containing protein [Microbulbifer sp. SAOS-129_SWC]|uniref:amino acid adenylation domain-containing protein n=1 Tax=Microbulbifer sp. SAOS-129_SWC TaxID=3145235 RepID=UPI00321729CF
MNVADKLARDGEGFTLAETEQSVAARFEKQVQIHGERLAVTDANASLSYDALNQLANRMARQILALVPASEPARVAIYLEKGIQYVAAVLAVLKCGHAYVPIDPEFPAARNQYIYGQSEAALLLSNGTNRQGAQALAGTQTQILDLDNVGENTSSENLDLEISPDALAYIIYTSGSTGRPKGVMQNQRNVLHGCMRRSNLQKVTAEDRMTLFYSFSVIASVYCMFGALLNGASLFPYDIQVEGVDKLAGWLKSRGITIYHSVASVFRQFARCYSDSSAVFDIRLVTFGGERVLTSDVALARRVFSRNIEFYTGLGSTETGTMRYFHIGPETEIDAEVVPIGYPVEGVDIQLLDEQGREVAAGEIGEITVRSRYITLGYWKNPQATAKTLSTDPRDPQTRIYRTGDLGQLDPDGLLHHRGRKDFQVKIRGFRVETSEVEAHLIDHPDIAEAVAVARDINNETQLVAYIVIEPGRELSVQQLRNYLRERLNYYMIPTVYVRQERLPKTPNNKVDRNALPPPDSSNELSCTELVNPRSKTEAYLVKFCRELLNRGAVGVNQNFFDLGGHSLTATQLLARINERFSVNLTMRHIFAAPNLESLAAVIDSAEPDAEAQGAITLQRAPADGRLPVSAAQRRMWLAAKLYGNNAVYNISNTVYLEGDLNIPALERALSTIVERHAILRTCFPADEEGPWQQVLPAETIPLETVDLCPVDPDTAIDSAQVLSICRKLLDEQQNLATGPLFRRALIRLGERKFILALVFNHIIYDNIWSSGIFFRELAHLYAGFARGVAVDLPALEFQFADYAFCEQRSLGSAVYERQLAYWQSQLADAPAVLDFPSDRPRPDSPDSAGGHVRFKLPASQWAAVQSFAQHEGATNFMLLVAVWQLLLHRYTQQDDILVGTPTGRRHHTKTEAMIGLFINTLTLRTDFSGQPSFRELLRRLRGVTIDAFSNDQVPFEEVVARINPPRDSRLSPFFQYLFIHRKITGKRWQLPGLKTAPVDLQSSGSKFDLTLSVLEQDQCLQGTIEYRSALFDRATVERIAQSYTQLLIAAIEHPDTPVRALEMVPEKERQRLCARWNQTQAPLVQACDTRKRFERRARQCPEDTALVTDTERLSYRQLNQRANAFARVLTESGVTAGDLVAVCLNRSADLVIALLAVWKAGGAYVPLDPDFPRDRLEYMLEDCGTGYLICSSGTQEPCSGFAGRVLQIDSGAVFDDAVAMENPGHVTEPDDLAYVIYTSGSTGKPKGVQVTQGGLVNFLLSMQSQPGFDTGDTLLAVTTICFDIAMLEIFLPLISGGRVVVQSRTAALNPEKITHSLREHGVTVMQATPATWRMLLDYGWKGEPGIRVLCGGEAMGQDLAQRLLDCELEVWNLYGPTETTIWSSVSRIRNKEDAEFIGQPIANTQLLVLGDAQTVQPLGVPGELCIGGDGLASGYLNRPELTAEKFINFPLSPRRRIYRTGDLVERLEDGRIAYLGRIDSQVKIRGFRVEVGEIEALIAEYPGVRQCVVIAHEDDYGSNTLAAYMIPANGEHIDIRQLRETLRASLPDYMIPSAFETVAEFPLTPNGKIDRKQFTRPEARSTIDATASVADGDDVSAAVISVLQQVLKVDVTSTEASFFDLGGHSLSALHVIARLNSQFSLEMPPTLLFDFPSVETLAAAIRRFINGQSEAQVIDSAELSEEAERQVDTIVDAVAANRDAATSANVAHGMRMRESKIARQWLAPMFAIDRRFVRTLLQKVILKLEGGSTFSTTMRKLYKKYYDIDVGDFTSIRFDPMRLKLTTRVGKYCTIYPTATFQNADHPRNTLSTHGIFYYSELGFSPGYELDRVQIEVGNDVWIGDGAKILYPTRKIGDGAVIAAGSIVVEDVPPYAVVAGYPARVVRYRFSRATIRKLLGLKWWQMSGNKLYQSRQQFMQPLEGDRVR